MVLCYPPALHRAAIQVYNYVLIITFTNVEHYVLLLVSWETGKTKNKLEGKQVEKVWADDVFSVISSRVFLFSVALDMLFAI